MTPSHHPESSTGKALVKAAVSLPDVTTGIACAGTSLESTTYIVAGKAFLFVGAKDARLKLGASLLDARALARRVPTACRVGNGGWTTISLLEKPAVSARVLAKWVKESYSLFTADSRPDA